MRFLRHIIYIIAAVFGTIGAAAQVNTDQVVRIGQNALYFEDYMLSIQYFNQAISRTIMVLRPMLRLP